MRNKHPVVMSGGGRVVVAHDDCTPAGVTVENTPHATTAHHQAMVRDDTAGEWLTIQPIDPPPDLLEAPMNRKERRAWMANHRTKRKLRYARN